MKIIRKGGCSMLYERIRGLATDKKMSIAELERKLELPNGMIGKWTKASPNSSNLHKVAKFFGVTMESLIEESEVKTNAETYSD